jgi:O-antigen/teichoic acid export membrane protein
MSDPALMVTAAPMPGGASPLPEAPPSDARHLVRSLFGFGVTQVLSWIAGLALLVMVPRFLGDVSLGRLGFALSITAMCGLIADLGVTSFLVKEVARTPARAGQLVVNALAISLPLTVISALGVLGALAIGGYDDTTRRLVLILSVGMVAAGVSGAIRAALQGLHRMRTLAVSPVVSNYTNAAGVTAALAAGGGVVSLAVVSVVANLAGLGVNTVDLARRVRMWGRPRWRACRFLVLGGLPFLVGQAALVVYGQIDTVLLSFFSRDAVIGWYAAALRLTSAAQFLPTMLTTVIYPMLSATSACPERFNAVAQRAFRLILLINLPIAVGIALLPDRVIHLLGYPVSFDHSIIPLLLLAAGMPMIALDMVIANALGAADRQRQWAIMGVAAAVLNVLVNLLAIPFTERVFHNGAIGAAAVTTLTEVFLLVTGICLLPRGVIDRRMLARSLRCVGASAAMAAVILPLRGAPLALPVVAGAITLAGASIGLRAVSMDEIRMVLGHLVRRWDRQRRTPGGAGT